MESCEHLHNAVEPRPKPRTEGCEDGSSHLLRLMRLPTFADTSRDDTEVSLNSVRAQIERTRGILKPDGRTISPHR